MTFDELMSETRRRRGNLDSLVREYLFEGVPFVFKYHPADYDLLRRHLSDQLHLQTSSITIVGSGRLGYSLNPSHPGQPILDTSDIDILIADEKLFDQFWQLMLKWRYPWHMKHWSEAERAWGTRHLENFIAGYSEPHGIRFARLGFRRYRTQLLDFSHRWFSAFKSTGNYPELAGREFKGRLYRSWTFATKYHAYGLRLLSHRFLPPGREGM
jgi:hypothetical protein